jgi:hypothetical protein
VTRADAAAIFTSLDISKQHNVSPFDEDDTILDDIYEVLNRHGITPDYVDEVTGDTAAMMAVAQDNRNLFKLISWFTDALAARNIRGGNVLHTLCNRWAETRDLAPITVLNREYVSAMAYVISSGQCRMTDEDNNGRTPLETILKIASPDKTALSTLRRCGIAFAAEELNRVLQLAIIYRDYELAKAVLEADVTILLPWTDDHEQIVDEIGTKVVIYGYNPAPPRVEADCVAPWVHDEQAVTMLELAFSITAQTRPEQPQM